MQMSTVWEQTKRKTANRACLVQSQQRLLPFRTPAGPEHDDGGFSSSWFVAADVLHMVDTFSISALHLAIKVPYFSHSAHKNEKVTNYLEAGQRRRLSMEHIRPEARRDARHAPPDPENMAPAANGAKGWGGPTFEKPRTAHASHGSLDGRQLEVCGRLLYDVGPRDD
eukprot:SAG31_NODE_4759_length_2974_cov_1.820522_3_plen_168_part_00